MAYPFPQTPIRDTFNRSNENPLATASSNRVWSTTNIQSTGTTNLLKLVGNQCLGINAAANNQYLTAIEGPDCEAYADVVTVPGAGIAIILYIRIINPGSAGNDSGYRLTVVANTSTWNIQRVDANVNTTIATSSTAFASGDSFGISCVGSLITAYRKPSGGSWGSVTSVTDATYGGPGVIGLGITNQTAVVDNLGGGTIPNQFLKMF